MEWNGREIQAGETYADQVFVADDMTEVTNKGASFVGCTFRDVRFNASAHGDAAFVGCTFVRCDFFDTTFERCDLVGSRFESCGYGLLRVQGGDWTAVSLPKADLSGCSLRGVRLREAELAGARFVDGAVRDCDLSGALLDRAVFDSCDLRGSDLSTLDPRNARLTGAVIDPRQAIELVESLGLRIRDA